MNDQQLIELVQGSPIEDFTLEQIRQLRARIPDSPELRAALNDRLRMDHHLADALGATGDTPDQFVQKILRRKQRQVYRTRWSLGLSALSLLLIVGIAGAAVHYAGGFGKSDIPQIETPSPTSKTSPPTESQLPQPMDSVVLEPTPPVEEVSQTPAPSQPKETDGLPVGTTNELPAEQPRELVGLPLAATEPISFAQLTALPDSDRHDSLTKAQFDQWFTPAAAPLKGEIEEFREADRPQVRLKGWFRLDGPLPPDTALRFELSHVEQMQFHFYCGDEGISVIRYRHDYNPWYAYAMRRSKDSALPHDLAVVASDGFREQRSNARNYDPVTFYFDSTRSELVVYRGDVEAIRAPLPSSPDEIYFAGESVVRRMNLWPLEALPEPQQPDYPVQVTIDKPAELPWQENMGENSHLEKNPGGSVSLVVDNPKDNSWACVPIPASGLSMIDLELSQVDRSFGIFLTTHDKPAEKGKPQEIPPPRDGIVFGHNRRTDQIFTRFSYIFDGNMETDRDPWEHPTSLVNDHLWVRLLQGGGQVRGWISRDGVHWALLPSEANNAKQYYDHLGIAAARSDGKRQMTIEKIIVRQLPTLTNLFPEDHWRKIDLIPWDQLGSRRNTGEAYSLPDGSPLPSDLATDLRRLSGKGLSFEDLVAIAEQAIAGQTPMRQQEIITELLTISKTWPMNHHEKRFLDWSHEKLDQIFISRLYSSDRQAADDYRRQQFNLPTIQRDTRDYLPSSQINAEVLAAIQQQRWNDVLLSCETVLRYYRYDRNRAARDFPILNWAGGIAVRYTGRAISAQDYLTEGRTSSMLVEDLSKEAYNISADLNAALESGAIEDACRLITQIPETAAEGLAPSADDPDHFFSVPAAIQMATESHQQLREKMQTQHADLAQLRLNSAIQRGDRKVIQLVTLQFFDTSAAAQAHMWLGDQATAAGNFATSLQHYLKAARSASPALQAEVDARIMMLGHVPPNHPQKPSGEVAIGSTQLSARDLVEQTSALRSTLSESTVAEPTPKDPTVTPLWSDEAWQSTDIRWDASWGNDAQSLPSFIRETKTDWRGRDIAVTTIGSEAYISNRFELIKLDLAQEQQVWKTSQQGNQRGKAHDYPFTRATPLVVGDLVLCRMLHDKGFALYAIDRESGKIRWESNLDGQLLLATDPIAVQGRVLLVTLKELTHSTYSVRLSRIDLATGEMVEHSPLFRIRDTWSDRAIGNIVQHQERLLIDLGGVMASCDISGYLQWVRKQLTFPQQIDNRWTQQQQSSIQIMDERAVAYHAGSMRMECVDIATGHLHWSIPAVNIQSVRSLDDDILLIEEPGKWLLVRVADGSTSVELPKPEELLHWQKAGDDLIALIQQTAPDKNTPARLIAVRIPLSGDEPAEVQSRELERNQIPGVGPSFNGDGHWYFWFQEDATNSQRQLVIVP